MARGDLVCPIDQTVLGLPPLAVKTGTDIARDSVVGSHVHLVVNTSFTCANGHVWHLVGDLLVERTA